MARDCGCTKGAAAVKYVYTPPAGGQKIEYTSEVQAQAAQIRDKARGRGIGSYKTVPK